MKTTIFSALFFFLFSGCIPSEKKISSGVIEISDGWVRPGKAGMMSAAYFNLKNGTSDTDTLLSISSNIASTTQIHESYETEEGLMGMQEQPFVALPKNETVPFKQGGLHVMIIRPERDLEDGDSVTFTLQFSGFDSLDITLPVKTFGN